MKITNWRTKLFGGIALIAAFVTQFPNLLGAVLDPDAAKKVAAWAAMISGFVAFCHTKDRQVSGNGTMDAPNQVAQSDGTSKTINPLVVALLLPTLLIVGCTTITDPASGKKHVASTFTIDQRKAFLGDVTALASFAAGAYGGPGAAAGLNALGVVAQGYVGKLIPSAVVAASPGVGSMGRDMAGLISPSQPVSQADVNAIFEAAAKAATVKPVDAKAAVPLGKRSEVRSQKSDIAARGVLLTPFWTVDFRTERIVDPPVPTGSRTSEAVWMRPLIVTREELP